MTDAVLTFVDVGQGDCTVVVDVADREGFVVDCPAKCAELALEHFRKSEGRVLRAVLATHNDLDHLGGLFELADIGGVEKVFVNLGTIIPADAQAAVKLTAALRSFAGLRDRGTTIEPFYAGSCLNIAGLELSALAPTHADLVQAQGQRDPNLASVVSLLKAGGRTVLLGGDAPASAWRSLLDAGVDLNVDLFMIPHHGAPMPDALVDELLEKADASFLIISVGTANTYGHPNPELLRRLAAARGRLLCTQVNGHCLNGVPLPRKQAEDGLPSISTLGRGLTKATSCPCAGSVQFRMTNKGPMTVSPTASEHTRVTGSLGAPCGG